MALILEKWMSPLTLIENWTKCFLCGKDIRIRVSTEEIGCTSRLPYSILNVHGNPPHVLIVYIDKRAFVRGQTQVDKIELTDELLTILKAKTHAPHLGKTPFT